MYMYLVNPTRLCIARIILEAEHGCVFMYIYVCV